MKYYDIILSLFIAVLLISNVVSAKIVQLGTFTFDGGTILFPLAYIFGDILTEVYGYKKSRRIIWLGFFANLLMAVIFIVVGKLPAASDWLNQGAYDVILGWVPRIVIASLIAYWAGEFTNSFVLAKIKILTKGKWLFTRTIGSTLVGQIVDTGLFCLIAFYGQLSTSLLLTVIISNYIFKVSVEVIFTPATYAIVGFLKKKEKIDVYDNNTSFNPFKLEV
jgi:queuosine precursor transporter